MKSRTLDLTKAVNDEQRLVSQFLLAFQRTKVYIDVEYPFTDPDSGSTYQFAQPLFLKKPNLKKHKPETQYPQYYVIEKSLGKGAYGYVAIVGYKIKFTELGYELKKYSEPYAIKIQKFEVSQSSTRTVENQMASWRNDIEREYAVIESQDELHGKNLAFSVKGKRKRAFFLMRYIPGVSLRRWMKLNPSAKPLQRTAITRALLDAYDAQLYQKNIVHSDIKPENIVLSEDEGVYQATFVDYGFACLVKDMTKGHSVMRLWGTPLYSAPQLYQHQSEPACTYNVDTDIWSLVVLLSALWGLDLNPFEKIKPAYVPFAIADAIIACDTLPVALRDYVRQAKKNNFNPVPSKEILFNALRTEAGLSIEASNKEAEAFKQTESSSSSSYALDGLLLGLTLTLAIAMVATVIILTHGAAAIFLLTAFTTLSVNLTLPGAIGLIVAAGAAMPMIGGFIGKRISQPPSPTLFAVSRSDSKAASKEDSSPRLLKPST